MATRRIHYATRWLFVVALLLPAASLSGCGDSAGTGLTRERLVGTWHEDPTLTPTPGGTAVVTSAGATRRMLVLNADGTFQLTVCDADGQPLDPPEYFAGKWRLAGSAVELTVKQTRLAPPHAGWVPDEPLTVQAGPAAERDRLELRGRDGRRVRLVRKAPLL